MAEGSIAWLDPYWVFRRPGGSFFVVSKDRGGRMQASFRSVFNDFLMAFGDIEIEYRICCLAHGANRGTWISCRLFVEVMWEEDGEKQSRAKQPLERSAPQAT